MVIFHQCVAPVGKSFPAGVLASAPLSHRWVGGFEGESAEGFKAAQNSPPLEGWQKFKEFLTGWFKKDSAIGG